MVILVVGGRKVPAFVERSRVIFVRREIPARADRALAVADFYKRYPLVDDRIIQREIVEIAERRPGVVKLGYRIREQFEYVVVLLQPVGSFIYGVLSRLEPRRVICVYMAGTVRPRHLKAVHAYKTAVGVAVGSVMARYPFGTHGAVSHRCRRRVVE